MLGKLSWAAIPFNEPIPLLTAAVVVIAILAVLGIITVKGWWPYLWREWLTSVDHKRIGVMYTLLSQCGKGVITYGGTPLLKPSRCASQPQSVPTPGKSARLGLMSVLSIR